MVFVEEVRASFESGSIVSFLIVVSTDPFDLILEFPIVGM